MESSPIRPLLNAVEPFKPAYKVTLCVLQTVVLLLFRLGFGWGSFHSGYQHLHNVDEMVDNFKEWGITFAPRFNVYMSGITEMIGGLLLMFGLATRPMGFLLAGNFFVALITAGKDSVLQAILGGQHLPPEHLNRVGRLVGYQPGRSVGLQAVWDDSATPFLLAALLSLAFGAGMVSIDYLLGRFVFKTISCCGAKSAGAKLPAAATGTASTIGRDFNSLR